MTAVVEDGELEFPQAGASGAELPADFRIEKRRDFPAVRQFPLFLGDEFLRNQPGNFRFYIILTAAVFVAQVLQNRMDGAAVGLAAAAFCEEGRAPEIPGGEFRLLRILRRFLVLGAAFAVGRRLLGGCAGRRIVGILEGQRFLQRLLHTVGHCGAGVHLFSNGVFRFRGIGNANHPWVISQLCLAGSAAQRVERSRLRMTHCRQQDPLSGTRRLPAQQLSPVKILPKGDILNYLSGIFLCVGHDQTIPCPGHGDIQHPQFLRQAFRRHFRGNGTLGDRGIAHAIFAVRHGKPHSQIPVAEDLSALALRVEPPGKVAEEHHRKFQSLGLVDTHNGHAPGRRRSR